MIDSTFRRVGAFVPLLLAASAGAQIHAPWEGYDTSVYPQGIVSWSSATADFNADGAQDLAVTSWYANSRLTVMFGDGNGRFGPPNFYTLPLGGIDLGVADFDHDGDVDIAVANTGQSWEGTSFSLFLNQGNGTFTDAGPRAAGTGPSGLVVADFNLDGHADVAVAHDAYINYGNSVAIMLGDGGGGFSSPDVHTLPSGTFDLEAGDLDGDGDPDLLVAHETGYVTVLKNLGTGWDGGTTYAAPSSTFSLPPCGAALSDTDRDGDLDVYFTSVYYDGGPGGPGYGALARFENLGGGALGPAQPIALHPAVAGGVSITAADVNGDQWSDLLVATELSQAWVLLLNDGAGDFVAGRELRAGEDPRAIEVVDLDGDLDRDVIVLASDSLEACVYLNPGDAAFEQPAVIGMVDPSYAPCSYSNLASGDVDLDGDLDLVVGYSANFASIYGVRVRRNQGDGTFAAWEDYSHPYFPEAIRLRDLDADGRLDLLFHDDSGSGRFGYRRNLGGGNFGPILLGPVVGCLPEPLEAFDVDNDGDLDVLGACYGEVKICKRNAAGTYAAAITHNVSGSVSALAAGDFDGDGVLDLATNSAVQGYVEISLGLGGGTYQPFFAQSGRDVRAIAVARIDGDAVLDLAVAFNLDGTGISILRGRGDGTFRPPLTYHGSFSATVDQVRSIALGDADGDGELDVFVANFGSQDVGYWRGHGDGTFDPIRRLGVGQQGWDVHFGEFTGDGQPDLAVLVQDWSPSWYFPGVVLMGGESQPPQTYCTGGTTTNGCVAAIDGTGAPSASAPNGFTLSVTGMEGQRSGLIFYGNSGRLALPWGLSSSFLCVKPPTQRTPPQSTGGTIAACNGSFALDWNAFRASHPTALGAPFVTGERFEAQAWFRDPPSPKTTHLSNALEFWLAP